MARAAWTAVLSLCLLASARAVTLPDTALAWNTNPETNISSYEVRYGTSPGNYPNAINAGNSTSAVVSGLQEGVTYYFVVYAYNKAGLKSTPSSEVAYRVDGRIIAPPSGTITSPAHDITITAGESVTFAGKASDPDKVTPLTNHWSFGSGSGVPDAKRLSPGTRQFSVPGVYTVSLTTTNASGVSDPTPATRTITVVSPISSVASRKKWKLKYVDSQETAGYAATGAIDGNTRTFWSTAWTGANLPPPPHEIQINLGSSTVVNGFRYLPRQDSLLVGNIAQYQFFVSADGKNWGQPVATGTFANSSEMKQIFCTPKRGKFVRLRQLTEANGYSDCSMAEFYVLQASKKTALDAAATLLAGNAKSAASATASVSSTAVSAVATATSALAQTTAGKSTTAETTSTTVIGGKKYLVLTCAKPAIPDGVTRTVQVSPNLLDWFSGKNHTTVLVDDSHYLKVRDNTPLAPGKKRYIRLKPLAR